MIRIAFISVHGCPVARLGENDTGGMNVYVLQLAKKLGSRGIKVDVYTRCHDPEDPMIIQLNRNARVIHMPAGPYKEHKDAIYKHLPQFVSLIRQFRENQRLTYDVVHTHYWLSAWVGNILSREWTVPHVTTFHTLAELKRRAHIRETESFLRIKEERLSIARTDHIIATSDHERDSLLHIYGTSPQKVSMIPCGVDTQLFRPIDKDTARQYVGVHGDSKTILFVGRIAPLKGIDLLLNSMAQLEETDNAQLLLVGGNARVGRQERQLHVLARQLGISHRVRFLGPLNQNVLPYYYSAADVCVVPSYYESFGMVALEALACGTPVIAARVGGLKSVIQDGRTGYLVHRHCPEPYGERLEVLLSNESLRYAMGKAGRIWASKMDWDSVARRVEEEYQHLLQKQSLATAVGE